jgi:GntR family transcriptional regulator
MLPADRFPGLLELPLGGSVYELLDEHFGTRPGEAVERIEVVAASQDEALVLDVPAGSPLLAITRTTTDTGGVPFEFSHDLFRGDRIRITVRTPGERAPAESTAGPGAAGAAAPRTEAPPGRVIELRPQTAS